MLKFDIILSRKLKRVKIIPKKERKMTILQSFDQEKFKDLEVNYFM